MSPTAAAEDAMRRIMKYYPVFQGALFVVDMLGNHGAAGVGWTFTYTVQNSSTAGPLVISVPPLSP
jgi:N4-(beta-N-acetylglucosaminyl)-L-asparaginase